MARTRGGKEAKSYTLPPSPSHSSSSSSSSDFEFTISISPRKSFSPADELFYKGRLLPLHLSPRISMVRNLLLSSSTSTSTTTSSAARDSTDSQSSFTSDLALFPDCDDSFRPSSVTVTEDDDFKRLHNKKTTTNHFSFSRFSSVFRKHNPKTPHPESVSGSSVKRMSNTVKEVIRKYTKKVKPLYEKLSLKQKQQEQQRTVPSLFTKTEISTKEINERKETKSVVSHSFSGNLRYPLRRKSVVSSCPSSTRSSPSHSGMLSGRILSGDTSTVEEMNNAIQGAITHCKNSFIQKQKYSD
ncbi:probable membrane-associated kinase regulator 1 [Gastrolobium bilobum]|uniref:probable membrane-associated kinase regulator 1 n=1 Tax=Gastrolobium bilobum TaxID=150636 RepID=UPI002AAFF674|nr:probable membrane-associated kinase regulator 1 [Gastrolobium bilobum]